MTPELASSLEKLSTDVRADPSNLPVLFWLRAYTTLALERGTPRIRWAKLSGFVSRTAREFGINGLDHAPVHALMTDYDIFQAAQIDSGDIVRGHDALMNLDWHRGYEVELLPEFQSELADVARWANETWEELRRAERADGALASILARWAPDGQSGLLPALIETQETRGWISKETLAQLAQGLGVPLSIAYGVADFYAMIYTTPVGKTIVRVCDDVPCFLAGSQKICAAVKGALGVGEGETTRDGAFTLELVPCLGHCDRAPVLMVGNTVQEQVTAELVSGLLALNSANHEGTKPQI